MSPTHLPQGAFVHPAFFQQIFFFSLLSSACFVRNIQYIKAWAVSFTEHADMLFMRIKTISCFTVLCVVA